MWPYTYMDCDFNKIVNFGAQGYCDGISTRPDGKEIKCDGCRKECAEKWRDDLGHPVNEMVGHLGQMEAAILEYAAFMHSVITARNYSYSFPFCF